MTNINSLEQGTKILAIAGDKPSTPQFINTVERERESLKLKYYVWLSRLFVLFAVLSLLVFMSSSLALFKLAPMVNVEPFLVINQDNSDRMVRYEPITRDMASKDLILETYIKQYVLLRNTIINDMTEMQSRWMPGGMVHFYSSWPVFEQFMGYAGMIFEQMHDVDLVREIEIISIGRLGGKNSAVWKVDFKTYDLTPGNTNTGGAMIMKEHYWTASVTAYFFPERQFMGRRLINPMGFTVTRYSQSEVEIF